MTDQRTDLVESLFQQALDLPESRRAAFLDRSCQGDATLRARIESLIEHADSAPGGFLEGGRTDAVYTRDLFDSTTGEHFGRYRITRLIGTGGMGAVYEAQQDNPHRRVALKLLRFGMAVPDVVKRFEREAQLLAHVNHPSVAHIYDAGVVQTPNGQQPYFAMEYIDGKPLDEWARDATRTIADRLKLMAQVCDAVHYAHQCGVIHRDLKPPNILVDAKGHPTVLDFGIARATEADIRTATIHTEVGQLVGTVPYMSPEQVVGHSNTIDARSDVFALGVILFELLAGKLPLQVRQCSIPEAARIIQEEDPSRLSSVNPIFRGYLETITAKALEKDRDRRYLSAAALADDLRRYLRDEPITARPSSTFYQLRKFARRNKRLVAVIALAFVSLSLTTLVAVQFAYREARQKSVAMRTTHRANLLAADSATLRCSS